MSKSLFDVNGNYEGEGGQGVVTQPGVDPTNGGHATVVSAGVEKLEDEVAAGNGVVKTNPDLPQWNYSSRVKQSTPTATVVESSNGGQSVEGSPAPAEKKVVIPRREDRKPAYPTKAMLDATETKRNIGELTPEQIDAVRNSDAQPRPLSQAEINAETQDIVDSINKEKAEKQQKKDVATDGSVTKTDGASVAGATSENANGTDGAGKTVVADNGGQSEVSKAEEAKTEVSVNTAKPDVSKEDYEAALKRINDDVKKGGIGTEEDKLIVFDYEHPHKPIPEMPKLEEFTPSQPPALKSIDSSYRTAYAIMQERMKAAGDDPASKAKRAKARRAELIVAALGDLLQVAANMWGAARGATSAKLSSIAGGVKKRHTAEDALALKREQQYAKDLERAITRDQALTKEANSRAMELWKAAENSRKYNVGEKNKAMLAEYNKKLQQWTNEEAQRGRDRHQVQLQHDRQVNYLNNHRYRSNEISQRTAGSIATAQERGRQSRLTEEQKHRHKQEEQQ